MKCNEVMSKDPLWCLPNDLLVKAAGLLNQLNIGLIPAIENEETKKLIGIFTHRNLALKVVAEGCDPKSTKVKEVMTPEVILRKTKNISKKINKGEKNGKSNSRLVK